MKHLVILFIFIMISVRSSALNKKPKDFVKSCFRDYVAAIAIVDGKKSSLKSETVRRRCLSKEFNAKWKDLISVNSTGADAFLLAQDYFESWISHQRVRNMTESSAEVVLGKGSEEHCLNVTVISEKSKPKISDIRNCLKN